MAAREISLDRKHGPRRAALVPLAPGEGYGRAVPAALDGRGIRAISLSGARPRRVEATTVENLLVGRTGGLEAPTPPNRFAIAGVEVDGPSRSATGEGEIVIAAHRTQEELVQG